LQYSFQHFSTSLLHSHQVRLKKYLKTNILYLTIKNYFKTGIKFKPDILQVIIPQNDDENKLKQQKTELKKISSVYEIYIIL